MDESLCFKECQETTPTSPSTVTGTTQVPECEEWRFLETRYYWCEKEQYFDFFRDKCLEKCQGSTTTTTTESTTTPSTVPSTTITSTITATTEHSELNKQELNRALAKRTK
ncbi:unnamed protein product [Cylicocyclus nassatus]|uniref:Uncharacterized protein n=1 Tax=Cylicocyclus nassatus TaxID=53992 RepID=A0AA36M098_CYLNA|nr:unnamed protein product [Cylicocyclus nassatus]